MELHHRVGLGLLDVRGKELAELVELLEAVGRAIGQSGQIADQRRALLLEEFGHEVSVGNFSTRYKLLLDGDSREPYCLPQRQAPSKRLKLVIAHSHRTQSAGDITTEQNGPDTATLTSQAGPTTRNL